MIGALASASSSQPNGIRPVNLSTDLAPLADLMELVFKDSMDSSSYAALREMRYLSRLGVGMHLISRLNAMTTGIGMGYVWIEDGRLVGNVSIYPADWPQDMGYTFIIANVGTHPDFQNRGIATRLMQTSLDAISERGGSRAILQVNYDNRTARQLYRKLGFAEERAWTTWRRGAYASIPSPLEADLFIRRRRRSEWREEMALAARIRPQARGGLGWQRPLHKRLFQPPLWHTLLNWLNLRATERLVVRDPRMDSLGAALWTEHQIANRTRLTLLNDPEAIPILAEALISNISRRHMRTPLEMEHPADDARMNDLLPRYNFRPLRTLMHMHWQAK